MSRLLKKKNLRKNFNEINDAYVNDPFLWTNELILQRYVDSCIAYSNNRDEYLELGIGHGIVLDRLSQAFESLTVLEGSSKLIVEHETRYPHVKFVETLFEEFETERKFEHIGMGFVLEHIDDPSAILQRFAKFLTDEGKMFIGVPSSSSMHRVIGLKAGLIDDLRKLSAQDLLFGHQRYLTYDDWRGIIEAEGLVISRSEGLFLAPFSTGQLSSLKLENAVIMALADLAREYPSLANSLFFEIRKKNKER